MQNLRLEFRKVSSRSAYSSSNAGVRVSTSKYCVVCMYGWKRVIVRSEKHVEHTLFVLHPFPSEDVVDGSGGGHWTHHNNLAVHLLTLEKRAVCVFCISHTDRHDTVRFSKRPAGSNNKHCNLLVKLCVFGSIFFDVLTPMGKQLDIARIPMKMTRSFHSFSG